MIEKISRDICIIKYRKLPLCEYEKVTNSNVYYYPEIHSFYWLKLQKEFEKKLPSQIILLTRNLNIDKLIFLGAMNKPWISKLTESRKDYKPLIKAVEYFKSHKIEKRFNGGVKVENKEMENFIRNFQIVTECDGGFFDFNFIDENENYLFYIHYSGELKILVLNENANTNFLKNIIQTKFIDSERENTNRIR
ncbi:hypothetical protein KIH23_10170 [Flavobacterium sp. CYK-55]|uniref:hypothetical protein n=1 Tax=Flavobacterium sp. CYK-55 TaxID=2835529 RepID=UPI001BCB6BE3|nr:hypothetical protein [Flavobacterium sp. CYK-55]MBS7787663.1 hypothetical protein [Flavobacterium sp. CYK-55]